MKVNNCQTKVMIPHRCLKHRMRPDQERYCAGGDAFKAGLTLPCTQSTRQNAYRYR